MYVRISLILEGRFFDVPYWMAFGFEVVDYFQCVVYMTGAKRDQLSSGHQTRFK